MMPGCKKDETSTFRFDARIEQLDNDGAKTQLVGEKWIYWNEFETISIASNTSSGKPSEGILVNHAGYGENYPEYNGVFLSTLQWNSEYFCGLYPEDSNNNVITPGSGNTFSTVRINLPAEQPYASDTSFAHNVMPMVAWYGGSTTDVPYTSPNLDFHSLGGIVRLQIYNPVNIDGMTINSIEITARDGKQLKGLFDVADYKTFDPHLTGCANTTENRTITITTPTGGIDFPKDELLTFYLVLPATKGIDDSTVYHLTMTINSTGGNCSKDFTVPIRRNGITYMRAIGIDNWYSGQSETGLAGNGTEARPFKIYTLADLKYVRNAFHSTPVKINGQTVDENTWFRIMTSSIELTDANWVSIDGGGFWSTGIENFKGHMTFYGTNSSSPGITNNSSLPIFQSIEANSTVEGLTVKCNVTNGTTGSYSPLCITNRGTLKDCRITTPGDVGLKWGISATNGGLAGICVTNEITGTIEGCGNSAKMACLNRPIAGICLLNKGIIKECYAASPMTGSHDAERTPSRLSGICDTAAPGSTIQDCYFAARIPNASYPCAGIVRHNSGDVIHCYASENALIITSASAAGIVGTNYEGGRVDYCWSQATLRARYAGMIAYTIEDGTFINCFCNDALAMITLSANTGEHFAGGFAAEMKDGTIENCFVYMSHINLLDNSGITGGFVGKLTGGTLSNCYVYESYSPTHNLYGTKGTDAVVENCHVVQGSGTVTGITNWPTSEFTNMQTALNSHVPTGGKEWEGAVDNTTPPHLEAYQITPSTGKQKHSKRQWN